MSEEICCAINKEKVKGTMNEWENDDSDILQALCNVYEKQDKFFFHTYWLT